MNQQRIRVHITISGKVQGVGFRAFVYDLASKYPIAGYVRNHYNGTVEAEAEGVQSEVQAFVEDISNKAPSGALITNVSTRSIDVVNNSDEGFHILGNSK